MKFDGTHFNNLPNQTRLLHDLLWGQKILDNKLAPVFHDKIKIYILSLNFTPDML